MRPVRRRRCVSRIVDYHDARHLLTERLGDYCSYCERPTAHAIEHALPWGPKGNPPVPQHPRLERSWTNLLLACTKCNNYKRHRQDAQPYGDRRQARARYLWPDTDNTFQAFEYFLTGDVKAGAGLAGALPQKAEDTIYMLGFDAPNDIRKHKRAQVWSTADLHLKSWLKAPSAENLDTIVSSARDVGHWSIWRTVFAAHPRVLARLDTVFPGTARSCFDPVTGAPVPRLRGQL